MLRRDKRRTDPSTSTTADAPPPGQSVPSGDELAVDLSGLAPMANPMLVGLGDPTPAGSRTDDGTALSADAQRYSAWADRLRDKRARDRANILGTTGERLSGPDGPGRPGAPGGVGSNWASTSIFSGHDPVDDPGVAPDPMRRSRLLTELGLEPDASADDAALAYRNAAKTHHPDRWVDADEATRTHHAETMMRLNAVHRALRTDFEG